MRHAPRRTAERALCCLAVVALTLLPAGCSAPEETEAKPADLAQRQPGSWQLIHYVIDFQATGLTGPMASMATAGKASVGKKDFGGPVCLSAAQAAKDTLTSRLNEAIRFGPEWKVAKSTVTDGRVDFAATLDDPQSGRATMTITGKITPTTSDLLVTTDSVQPQPGKGRIRTVMKQENTRVGDCKPGEDPMS